VRFGAVPLAEAEGAVLAHSMMCTGRAGKPYRIAKGTLLSRDHIRDLATGGETQVTVARLDPFDVAEDDAARFLAKAIVPDPEGQGLRISGAGAGRVNLCATRPGLVRLDVAAIEAVNGVDPMITIATVPDYHRSDAGAMLATIKIISYGVALQALQEAAGRGAGAIKVLAPVYRTATLIETLLNPETPADKGRRATAARLERMGMHLTPRNFADHDEPGLAQAIAEAPGEVILILTASATSDPMDVGPAALRRAGGQVTRFGMPVDPGNLLFLGQFGEKPVIGLPGCARSPALNGADWVLERVICGLKVTDQDIAAMAVGGLLKEIPTRPQPRAGGISPDDTPAIF
jgi:molybdenum cofactor cytidylyltransferase